MYKAIKVYLVSCRTFELRKPSSKTLVGTYKFNGSNYVNYMSLII